MLVWVPAQAACPGRGRRDLLDPAGPGRYAPVDPAAVAAVTLTQDGRQGRQYVLTGDQALTVTEQVQILSAATGQAIKIREPPPPTRPSTPASPALADAIIEGFALMRADTTGSARPGSAAADRAAGYVGRPGRC